MRPNCVLPFYCTKLEKDKPHTHKGTFVTKPNGEDCIFSSTVNKRPFSKYNFPFLFLLRLSAFKQLLEKQCAKLKYSEKTIKKVGSVKVTSQFLGGFDLYILD